MNGREKHYRTRLVAAQTRRQKLNAATEWVRAAWAHRTDEEVDRVVARLEAIAREVNDGDCE